MTKIEETRLRVEVVDVFRGLVSDTGESWDGGLRFYKPGEEEDMWINIENCHVTVVRDTQEEGNKHQEDEGERIGHTGDKNESVCEARAGEIIKTSDKSVILPEEYHVGDVSRCQDTQQMANEGGEDEAFDYPASMTQGDSPEGGRRSLCIQTLLQQKQTPKIDTSSIFTTGSGKQLDVQLSKEKLDAARKLLADIDTPRPQEQAAGKHVTSVFTTGSGSKISISKEKLDAAAKMVLDTDDERYARDEASPRQFSRSTVSIFTTGAGSKISISRENMDAAARFLAEDTKTPLKDDEKRLDHKTPAMSRFLPHDSKPTANLANRASTLQTPGNSLLARKRHRSSSGLQTPRLITPQNNATSTHKIVTPGSSIVEKTPLLGSARNLPVSPELASKYCFGDSYGPGDIRAYLLLMEANADVVVDEWVRNHYKWVVWKLALIDLYTLTPMRADVDSVLHYERVKDAIYDRYKIEYLEGKSSFLKKVFQRDIPSILPCILKVASIHQMQSTCRMELTDGWYSIFCDCDEELTNLVRLHKIHIGKKLRISGAELVGGSPGLPLEAVKSSRLILGYNQVHPARHSAKLGLQRNGIPITPLSYIHEKGGKIPRSVVTILRVFPPLVWSKLLSGVSTFQTKNLASKAVSVLDAEFEQLSVRSREIVQLEELEMCKKWLERGSEGGVSNIEKLYATFVVSQSQNGSFVEGLEEHDKDLLQQYISDRMLELDQIQQKRFKDLLEQEFPAASGAKSTPCQTILIGEVSYKAMTQRAPMEYMNPSHFSKMALLTVWNPSERVSNAKEGDVVSVTAMSTFTRDISSQKYRGNFLGALKHLQTTPSSEINIIGKHCVNPDRVVQTLHDPQRRTMTIQDLLENHRQNLIPPNILNVAGFVVRAGPVYLSTDLSYHYQWVFLIDATQDAIETHGNAWMMAIHLCGPQDAIKWFEANSSDIVCHFDNVSVTCFDEQNHIIALEGGMATSIGREKTQPAGSRLHRIALERAQFVENLRARADTVMAK